jgi:hypothetical protein
LRFSRFVAQRPAAAEFLRCVSRMVYQPLPSEEQLTTLRHWLAENSPLFVDDFWQAAGGSTPQYFIRSVNDFIEIISLPARPRRIITIFRQLYPIRGFADEQLIVNALAAIREDETYAIFSLAESDCYPAKSQDLAEGYRGHSDLRRDLQSVEVRGKLVAVGPCPFGGDESWITGRPDVLRFTLTTTQP